MCDNNEYAHTAKRQFYIGRNSQSERQGGRALSNWLAFAKKRGIYARDARQREEWAEPLPAPE
jgi:hypothetical protein